MPECGEDPGVLNKSPKELAKGGDRNKDASGRSEKNDKRELRTDEAIEKDKRKRRTR